jgi:hypothetical protein
MTRKQAIRAADKAFSFYIRTRDIQCVTCGAPTSDCSHFFRRGHHGARWDEHNAAGQCRRCHMVHHNQTETYLHDYARKHLGKKRYEELRDRWEGETHFKTYQIEEIARYYRTKLEGMV